MNKLGEIMDSEINEIPRIFGELVSSNQITEKLAGFLKTEKIQSILLLARGTSDNAAHFFKYLVETQLGLPCGLTSPSAVTIYDSKLHYEGTLVVAISQSGQSTDLVEFAKAAKRSGAKLISITNNETSPLAVGSDFHLSLGTGPELAVAATKTYAAQLLISYLLVMAWAGKKPHTEDLVSQAEAVLEQCTQLASAVEKIDLKRELVVLGRGFAYPNAKEAALKIQETSKVNVQGMSTADYLHGPISALNEDTQVIFITPNKMPSNSIVEALLKIRPITKHIFWIGNASDPIAGEIKLGGASCSDEITSSIVDAIVLQKLSLYLAVNNGFNPDAPKGLSKVTMTI